MTKMCGGQVHGQQFLVKSIVIDFCWGHLLRKEGNRMPCTIYDLLQDYSNCCVGCISYETDEMITDTHWQGLPLWQRTQSKRHHSICLRLGLSGSEEGRRGCIRLCSVVEICDNRLMN